MAYEIHKFAGMMYAVVAADRAPEAKNAQVMGENENSKGLKKRKNSDRNGQKSDKSKSNEKKCSFWGRSGVKQVKMLIESVWNNFSENVLPTAARSTFWKNVMREMS